MYETISYWLFIFFLFNVMGWVLESSIESLYHKRPINRGFLDGPYIPIYGVGGIMMALIGMPLRENGFLVYLAGVAAATVLEYFIGSVLERVFGKQFWDYSMMPFTYKNRISLISSMFWGVLSLFVTYVVYDFVSAFVITVDPFVRNIANACMIVIMGIDAFVQIKRQANFRNLLPKLSREQAREFISKTIMRIGTPEQIREALHPAQIKETLKERLKRISEFFESDNSENNTANENVNDNGVNKDKDDNGNNNNSN